MGTQNETNTVYVSQARRICESENGRRIAAKQYRPGFILPEVPGSYRRSIYSPETACYPSGSGKTLEA
jgi:hypothetical protein